MLEVEKTLQKFASNVIKQARTNLTKSGKKDRGELYDSMSFNVKENRNSFELDINLADYWEFVDLGVQGKSSNSKAPNSPFKFGSGTGKKGSLTNAIDKWVQRKRFQFKDKKGKFLSYKATAFIITRSIYQTGIKPTNFFNKPFKNEFNKLPDELIEAYALDVENLLKFAVK